METAVLAPDSTQGKGELVTDRHERRDTRLLRKAIDKQWHISADNRKRAVQEAMRLLDSDREMVRAAGLKVLVSMTMVNVNLMRIDQAQEQGPASNVTVNMYNGQIIQAQVLLGMAPAERERLLSSGAQLAPDAIAALTTDEVQRWQRASCSVQPQLKQQ